MSSETSDNPTPAMVNGKYVKNMQRFEFSTGKVAYIRKVSPMLAEDVRRSFPAPKPPVNTVDYGDGEKREEPNLADPAYQQALVEYEQEFGTKVNKLYIKLGTEVEIDQDELAAIREALASEGATMEEADDKYLYITRVCVGEAEDLQDLFAAIMRRVQPSQEALDAAKATFRS